MRNGYVNNALWSRRHINNGGQPGRIIWAICSREERVGVAANIGNLTIKSGPVEGELKVLTRLASPRTAPDDPQVVDQRTCASSFMDRTAYTY